ncbi:trypsin-like peptidase domain-containing protein [Candidatus Dojkabacteria bacterium]|nr:trypsin-like peptidase domain-containing protein [Candidatus Dojkabacteria bacterium]
MEIKDNKPKTTNAKLKKASCFGLFFIFLFLACGGTVALGWAGGWLKELTCSVVLEDSMIWDQVNCVRVEEEASQIEQGEVIDMQLPKDIQSTEELVTKIIEEASPAVVTVAVDTYELDYEKGFIGSQDGIGSGFVVDSDGLIITNQHVVSDESSDYSVILPEEEKAIPVEKIYRDKTNDIAILKIDRTGLKALKFGDSDKLKRGNLVVAIGNPLGSLEGTATVGYVTGLNRDVTASSGFFGSVTHYEGVIQTDAAINPGNSGGPLLNSRGEIIGVNFATTSGADNISFAIPINRVKNRLELFEKEGRFPQPYIGVSYSQRTLFLDGDVVIGALILEVEKGGPADRAGVQKGDVVLSIDGKDLSEYDLSSVIQGSEVGKKLNLKVLRDKETVDLGVVVADKGE